MHASLVLCALAALVATGPAPKLTAEELVAKHVAARGGLDKLRSIKTLRREGRLVLPARKLEMKLRETVARPSKIRTDTTFQGLVETNAFDGKDGWRVEPFEGRKDPERVSADESKSLAVDADFEMPFVDAKAKGHTLELLGTEDVDGTAAYKLRVKLKSGDQLIAFIDPDSLMLIRTLRTERVRGAEREYETDYGEYEKVDGVYFPMSEEFGQKDSAASRKVKALYDTAKVNVPVDDRLFAFPEGK